MLNLPEPPLEVLQEYEQLDGVPQSILDSAVYAENEEDARKMASAFLGDRHGYANNNSMPDPEGILK